VLEATGEVSSSRVENDLGGILSVHLEKVSFLLLGGRGQTPRREALKRAPRPAGDFFPLLQSASGGAVGKMS